MPDQLSAHYRDLLAGSYDCVDRIVLNAYFRLGMNPGGFRYWWRQLTGSEEQLDNDHLMRMAGRVRAYAKAHNIPVKDCAPGEKKHKIGEQHLMGEQHLAGGEVQPGLFLILVAKAPALVWEITKRDGGQLGTIQAKGHRPHGKARWPFVNHYSFHIWDQEWGHITIQMSGHPPFGAQVMWNGHEFVACQASQEKIDLQKEDHCFTESADAAGLARVADTLSQSGAVGRLSQVCERWLYTTCLVFGLDLEEQQRSGFRYQYSTYQVEYSRHLQFQVGQQNGRGVPGTD
jgi:hypothetical protein